MSGSKINGKTNRCQRMGKGPALIGAIGIALALAGCEEGQGFNLFGPKDGASAEATETAAPVRTGGATVERDVEAPDVFQVTDEGLWDGRPSLGGVWVAHTDVAEPLRVVVRNSANGKDVVGALFRRERATPGPSIQVSSEAAEALGIIAGQPATLEVTALIREEIEQLPPEPAMAAEAEILSPEEIEETTLDPIAAASAAIDTGNEPAITPATDHPTPVAAAAESAPSSSLEKPFIQIGIFSVEENANNTATSMRQAGMVPIVHEQSANGRHFWRVVIGPASNRSERADLLAKVKDLGFQDAYFVSR